MYLEPTAAAPRPLPAVPPSATAVASRVRTRPILIVSYQPMRSSLDDSQRRWLRNGLAAGTPRGLSTKETAPRGARRWTCVS
eukprot:692852-Prymnesium_polylepis.1